MKRSEIVDVNATRGPLPKAYEEASVEIERKLDKDQNEQWDLKNDVTRRFWDKEFNLKRKNCSKCNKFYRLGSSFCSDKRKFSEFDLGMIDGVDFSQTYVSAKPILICKKCYNNLVKEEDTRLRKFIDYACDDNRKANYWEKNEIEIVKQGM